MNRPMYKISDEYLSILEAFEYAETDEEISELEQRLKAIDEEHDVKGENLCAFVKTLSVLEKEAEAQRKVFADLALEWAKKRDARENKRRRVSEYLRSEMERLGFVKRKYGNFSTWPTESVKALVPDPEKVPAEYRRPGEPNITLIKEELLAGVEFDFATLDKKKSLQIR